MDHFKTIIWILAVILLLHGCNRGTPTIPPPSPDTSPPVWDDTVGVTSVIPGEGTVTVQWGTATDAESPPVEYLVYMDTDDDPWDQEPLIRPTNEPYTFDGLWTSIDYSFGVRCRDSVEIPNVDDNSVVMSTETIPRGWALSWGGILEPWGYKGRAYGTEVKLDGAGNIYVCGTYAGYVDFDPGPGTHILEGVDDVSFVSKFDPSGNLQWVTEFPGTFSYAMDVNTLGYICLASRNSESIYYSRFNLIDPTGNKVMTGGFGPDFQDNADINAVQIDDSQNFYLAGGYFGSVDFDPTSSVHNEYGSWDAWVGKYDWSGNLLSFIKWGDNSNWVNCTALTVMENGDFICGGHFNDVVDFDPGPGIEIADSVGSWDSFLISFDQNGDLNWVQTWGNLGLDYVMNISTDELGNIYILGLFGDVIDLDPGPEEDMTGVDGSSSSYICRYTGAGDYTWGISLDAIYDTCFTAGNGTFCVGGIFGGTRDFDPGSETEWRTAIGGDMFVATFDSNGNFNWVRSFGGESYDDCDGVTFDTAGNIYFTGVFPLTLDFDPGSGVDIHDTGGIYPLESMHVTCAYLSKLAPDGYW